MCIYAHIYMYVYNLYWYIKFFDNMVELQLNIFKCKFAGDLG